MSPTDRFLLKPPERIDWFQLIIADPSLEELPIGENLSPSTSICRHVEWVDTDASGRHHNSAVVRWVEVAEAQLIRELGVSGYFPVSPWVQHVGNFRHAL